MSQETLEKLFMGSYEYFQNDQNYSMENFSVDIDEKTRDLYYRSEIMSRVETGEFFKMRVEYVVNQFYAPQWITIEKFLGEKMAREKYEIDHPNQLLRYTFKSNQETKTIERPFSTKHYISAPCFVTSALFTATKKLDTTSRTPVIFISSSNEWHFEKAPEDKVLWVDTKTHTTEDLVIDGITLTSNQYELHEEDALTAANGIHATLWVSKNYCIPYKLEDDSGTSIVVKKMKKLQQDQQKIF